MINRMRRKTFLISVYTPDYYDSIYNGWWKVTVHTHFPDANIFACMARKLLLNSFMVFRPDLINTIVINPTTHQVCCTDDIRINFQYKLSIQRTFQPQYAQVYINTDMLMVS